MPIHALFFSSGLFSDTASTVYDVLRFGSSLFESRHGLPLISRLPIRPIVGQWQDTPVSPSIVTSIVNWLFLFSITPSTRGVVNTNIFSYVWNALLCLFLQSSAIFIKEISSSSRIVTESTQSMHDGSSVIHHTVSYAMGLCFSMPSTWPISNLCPGLSFLAANNKSCFPSFSSM